jgi:hypothetical protein
LGPKSDLKNYVDGWKEDDKRWQILNTMAEIKRPDGMNLSSLLGLSVLNRNQIPYIWNPDFNVNPYIFLLL